jgi:hypothetical protein
VDVLRRTGTGFAPDPQIEDMAAVIDLPTIGAALAMTDIYSA